MSEVRSSDLETGLSSSDDCMISKATSLSTPYKAWNISCSLTRKDEQWIRDRFSKQKLAKAQEKKAKGSSVSVLLSKKKTGDASNRDSVVIPPPAHLPAKRPASPTSSLEVIASSGDEEEEESWW
ncbi:hypothetical protein SO802_000137 [Lithocarpus litseifolius]|uniref:Uncharacterized protein n=1 Tax=Lithocarpus litseifolius TaxID=425828 RepID=A0AAW2DR54_9ROSI